MITVVEFQDVRFSIFLLPLFGFPKGRLLLLGFYVVKCKELK